MCLVREMISFSIYKNFFKNTFLGFSFVPSSNINFAFFFFFPLSTFSCEAADLRRLGLWKAKKVSLAGICFMWKNVYVCKVTFLQGVSRCAVWVRTDHMTSAAGKKSRVLQTALIVSARDSSSVMKKPLSHYFESHCSE